MCNAAAATWTYARTYVPSLCRDRHRAVETMRFSTPPVRLPPQRVLAPRSQSLVLVSISSLFLHLSPSFAASDDNRILSERALARAISRPICSFLQEEPTTIAHASRTPGGFRTGRSSSAGVFSLVGYVHARSHAHDSRPGGRFQSEGQGREGRSTRTMRRTAAATAATTTMAHAKASRRRYETGGYLFPCYMGTLSSA